MKRFLVTTAFVAATAIPLGLGAAYADDTTAPQTPAVTPAPADQNNAPAETQAPAAQAPATTPSPAAQAPADNAPAATAATQTPPPSDAIIAAQGSSDLRADKIIGMKVYNPDGQEVGKVKDVLFDANGNVKGVVLNVGGVLGIGAKPVGLQWKELDVQPAANMVKVNYTKEQLEAAPSFQAQEASGAVSSEPAQPVTPAAPASPSESAPAPSTQPSN